MTSQDADRVLDRIQQLLEKGDEQQALDLLSTLLPADKASFFEALSEEAQERLLPSIEPQDAADILEELDEDDAAAMAEQLDNELLSQVLDEMEPDEAADLLGDLSPTRRLKALEGMTTIDEVRPLLRYPDDSAGGLMTSGYYSFRDSSRAVDVIRSIRDEPAPAEEIPYVYAVDEDGTLTGVMRLADLIRAHPEQTLASIAKTEIVSIDAFEDQEVAARLLNRYDLMAIPVLDIRGRIVGVITADDAMAALEQEASEDIYMSAGITATGAEESARGDLLVNGPLWRTWWVRTPVLLFTLFGGMVAGAVIGAYQETLETITALAFFIPVVMDMGGNAGVQSTAVFVRGHALGQIDFDRFIRHLVRELLIGVGMGLVLGVLAGTVAALWQGLPEIGIVVGLSLASTMTLAVTLGFLIPFVLVKLGVDPAAGADPLITMIKDITGLIIYFFFAFQFMGHLL